MKKLRNEMTLLALVLGLSACSAATDEVDAPAPEEDIQISVDGRADSLGVSVTDDEVQAVLDIANTYSFEELDALLDVRAARNIVEARVPNPIGSIEELDAIPYVGMRAFTTLLAEARSFLQVDRDPSSYDVSEQFQVRVIEGRYSSTVRLGFGGELLADLQEQPFAGRTILCRNDSCEMVYSFDEINDYSSTAGPGNVVASFRSDEISNNRQRDGFRGMARAVIESRNDGPLQCVELENNGPCIALYGGCSTQYRCNVRLPE